MMQKFTVNLNRYPPTTLADMSELFALLLNVEDTDNQALTVELPFPTTINRINHCLSLMMNENHLNTYQHLIIEDNCFQLLHLLDFLSAPKAMDSIFTMMVVSDTATLHSTWIFAQALKKLITTQENLYRHFDSTFTAHGIKLQQLLQITTPRKARTYIRSSLRAARFMQNKNTFKCPFCSVRLHFKRDNAIIAQVPCCGSRIHITPDCADSFLSNWNCIHCDCQLDEEGNMLWPEHFLGEGSRFQVRAKRRVPAYKVLPNIKLAQIARKSERLRPWFPDES